MTPNKTPAYSLMFMIGLCVYVALGKKDVSQGWTEVEKANQRHKVLSEILWLRGKYSGSVNMWVTDAS